MTDDHDAAGAMNFIFEAGVLKRAARTGWWFATQTSWNASSKPSSTASAHRLADAALGGQPLAWLTPRHRSKRSIARRDAVLAEERPDSADVAEGERDVE
ncbi:hypothetical protein ACLQ3F_09635 [Micromonospora sp. DT15]|uniref:hypothetical protein n=1 Tax=Micromonospora sp. DT15 TaxID=3393445 RepID=UPI003CF9A498